MANQIQMIVPYKDHGQWMFDDATTGLHRELFISGADTLMDVMTMHIPGAGDGFKLIFSHEWFPDHDHQFERMHAEGGGVWYKHKRSALHGWLCPAMFLYFEKAPAEIYVQCKPME